MRDGTLGANTLSTNAHVATSDPTIATRRQSNTLMRTDVTGPANTKFCC